MRVQRRIVPALVIVCLLAALLAGQALADRVAPSGYADTGEVLGRTSFAYLTVLRTFAAAALWNRLDPQFHEYYEGSLDQASFAIPTMRIVTWLDPQMVEAYYTGPWIVRRLGNNDEALDFALEGVERNPRAGILWAQLAQMYFIDGDTETAYDYARRGMGDVYWRSDSDQFEGYGILHAVFVDAGDLELAAAAEAVLLRLEVQGDAAIPGEHEHGPDCDH